MVVFTLLFVVVIAVITIGMFYGARWAMGRIQGTLVERLRAGESIVNNGQVPPNWLAPHRKRIDAMRAGGKGEAELERAGLAAQRDCMHRIDDLLLFFDKRRVTADSVTQNRLMAALRAERARWAAASWRDFMSGEMPPRAPASVERVQTLVEAGLRVPSTDDQPGSSRLK